ncbi:hypothetical protein A3Q56_05739 [Intoshia linei]|uniref:Acylamino-acid-releasing enzyme N-terminal domain-containing protein n=1 Tax=Intoshia linei TaxID=1819745 RepID=A0A177AYE4_9BILA|nr:hypothetical protein A3Q56_05739 [Intoshia linei]
MDLKEKIKKMEKAYIKMTTQPVITSAEIEELNHEILIDLTRTSTDVIMQNKRKMLTTLHYSPKSKSYKIINTVEQTNTVCDVKNRLGGRIKIINQNERSYLEIWSKTEKHTSIDLTKLNLHGKVLENNENFNSLKWSQDCKYFCYLAEKDKAPEKQKYFNDEQDYNKYVFKESFGEQLSTIYDPVLVLINTDNLEIKIFDDFTEEYSIFSANFSYSDNILVVTCYLTKPYKFGQRFINNTDTKVFLLDYESKKVSTIQKYAKCFYNNETLKNVNDIENFDFPKVCFRNCIFLKSDLNEMCLLSTRTNVQGAHFQHSW